MLTPVVLGPNVLDKGVGTGLVITHPSPACAQTMSRLPRASFICSWQVKLLWMSHNKQT